MVVSDLDRSIEFYTTVLGFQVLRKTDNSVYLYLGTDLLELNQGRTTDSIQSPASPEAWLNEMNGTPGLRHLGFRANNLDEIVGRLERHQVQMIVPVRRFQPCIEHVESTSDEKLRRASRPQGSDNWRIVMFSDPDGIMLEFIER
ncbi:VOC family protein [Candidatus Bipolaricaulota bacterium]